MAARITTRDLQAVCDRINRTVNGEVQDPWTRGADGHLHASIGVYVLDGAYGGWELHRLVNDGGGAADVFGIGHVPKRDLYQAMHAFLRGLEVCEELS